MKKLLTILFIIIIILFIISFSISFTILFRPFYYYEITHLKIEENTNYSYDEIKEAYDDVLDYCLLNKEFKTGKLKYSEEGKKHFKDCKKLFMINFIILGLSTVIILITRKKYKDIKLLGFRPSFYSSIIIIIILIVLTIIALTVGFEELFAKFHNVFFYNKDNWLFDPTKDEIIKILPIEYFRDCGILIISMISIISIMNIIKEVLLKKKIHKEV